MADNWDTSIPPKVAPQPDPEPQTLVPVSESSLGITIADATESYLSNRRNRGIESPTVAKYQTFIKQLRAYCDERGYVRLNQLAVQDMDRFYASWNDGKRSSLLSHWFVI